MSGPALAALLASPHGMRRQVEYEFCTKRLATERGVRQFIDLGAGFPTQGNTHEVVAGVRADGEVAGR